MRINCKPFPRVRVNWKSWRFTPRAKNYHLQMNELRDMIWDRKDELIKLILSWNYEITFHMPMADSWSVKKKVTKYETFHDQKPDIDNMFKALTDTLFYNTDYNDKDIFRINCYKIWDYEWFIEIKTL